jgi:uracil-DNA glycosylase family 4
MSELTTPPVQVDEALNEYQNGRDEAVSAAIDDLTRMVAPQVGGKPPRHLQALLKRQKGQAGKKKSDEPASLYPVDFEGHEPPQTMWSDKTIGDRTYEIPRTLPPVTIKGIKHLRGRGSMDAPIDILFVSPCVLQEEYDSGRSNKPQMLRGGPGSLFYRSLERSGIDQTQWYYTTIAKYNTPRLKLKSADVRWGTPALEDEIRTLKPRMIVCLGKQVFDFFIAPAKLTLKDVQGAFFQSDKYGCALYVMDSLVVPTYKPEYLDRFETDLRNIATEVRAMKGTTRVVIPTQYVTISDTPTLFNVLIELQRRQINEVSVDCEWHGQTAWSGQLRSFQFAWAPGEAAYVRFMNERQKYSFDRPIREVGNVLGRYFNRPEMKYIGHNASADMPWMYEHLGLDVYRKVIFDTMYAQHTVNEASDLKLERLSVRYTDLGRYDLPLLLWKKKHKFDEENDEGYGKVSDEIIIPYALKDADATLRCKPILEEALRKQDLWTYYNTFVLPFVTDGFFEMMSCGLPVNVEFMDEMREVFTRNRDLLMTDFRADITREAFAKLGDVIRNCEPSRWQDILLDIIELLKKRDANSVFEAEELFKNSVKDAKKLPSVMPVFLHAAIAQGFNVDNPAQIGRWLFDVKGFQPIKTTKRDGVALSWDKVLSMSEKDRRELNPTPATDKQVIKILAEQDKMVARLQELKAVSTIVKSFLKGPETVKTDAGTLEREQGMHKWVQPDGRIHANFALTETARPRAWKPNILNWPKVVTKPIEASFKRINERFTRELREHLESLSEDLVQDRAAVEAEIVRRTRLPHSLRANIQAPPGYAILDMDLKTAEVVSLAYQSGDSNMIKVLTEPDTQFARTDPSNPKIALRIGYNGNEGIPEDEWDAALLVPVDDPRFMRTDSGALIHPKRDLHWEMGTPVARKPREKCDERLVRDGVGKVGNFCISAGYKVLTKERGLVPIEDITCCDSLWDGVEWVSNEGVTCNGIQTVYEYQGIEATDNHEVWTESGEKVTFGQARAQRLRLARTATESGEPIVARFNRGRAEHTEKGHRLLLRDDHLQSLRCETREGTSKHGERFLVEVSVSEQALLPRSSSLYARRPVRSHATAVRTRFSRLFSELQRAWNQGSVQDAQGVHKVGAREMAGQRLLRSGSGQNRQRWALLKGEFATCIPVGKSAEQAGYCECREYRDSQSLDSATPGDQIQGSVCEKTITHWPYGDRHLGASKEKGRRVKVYDILNAGPRHRFTCGGILVSNSIPYGATGSLLERMIEANTGIKPPEDTGSDMIEAWRGKYPRADEYQRSMEEIVRDPGYWRALSGRVRHFCYSELEDLRGYEQYKKRGILSGLARQARNFPHQEIVAATTARALLMFLEERRRLKMQSRVGILLYDAVTAFCPLEELKTAAALLQRCLTVDNEWDWSGGKFHFDVDISIGFRWGVKPTKEEKAVIDKYMK